MVGNVIDHAEPLPRAALRQAKEDGRLEAVQLRASNGADAVDGSREALLIGRRQEGQGPERRADRPGEALHLASGEDRPAADGEEVSAE